MPQEAVLNIMNENWPTRDRTVMLSGLNQQEYTYKNSQY